jgi:NAD+ kinase
LPRAAELAAQIAEKYKNRCKWWSANESTLAHEEADDRLRDTDLIVTVGGDGTILRGMHAASLHGIPVLGVNMGRVGFMSEIDSSEALEAIQWYLEGNARIDERLMLKAVLEGDEEEALHAVNDVTVHRGAELRMIEVKAVIDDVELSTYRGDGLIVASSTGSTSYTLQLGGPVISPNSPVFLLKPIAGHMSQFGGVVLDSNSELRLMLNASENAILTVDGYISRTIRDGDMVRLLRSERSAKFLRRGPKSAFWEGLSHRLGMRIGTVRRGEATSG